MNPARLAELERQRALVRSHLEWLDREIARETAGSANSPATVQTALQPTPPTSPLPTAVMTGLTDNLDPDPLSAAATARRGCLLYLCIALLLISGALIALYFGRYRGHPLLFVSRDAPSAEKISPSSKPATPSK